MNTIPIDRQDLAELSHAASVFGEALLARDRAVACDLVASLALVHGGFTVIDSVIAPAMQEIGERWECGDIDVATEHAATFVAREALAILDRTCRVRSWLPTAPRVLTFAPSGELHELPVVMVASAMERLGWQTLSLGCNMPALEAAAMARIFRADVVCMSITSADGADAAVDAVRALASIGEPRPEIWVGGGATTDEALVLRLRAAGVRFVGASIADLACMADRRVVIAAG
ncbi:MAG: Methionine synthase B12-binding module cap domain protein [Thermoleophilia bacterium]|nr:Methionine synthase B12-binding module cap domain protein [Thermoleophilia bacterium]